MPRPKVTIAPPRVGTSDARRVRPPPKVADPFYLSADWRALLASTIAQRGRRCEAPNCRRSHGRDGETVRIFGDHIIEIKDDGARLDPANIRLLCGSCHTKKTAEIRAKRLSKEA